MCSGSVELQTHGVSPCGSGVSGAYEVPQLCSSPISCASSTSSSPTKRNAMQTSAEASSSPRRSISPAEKWCVHPPCIVPMCVCTKIECILVDGFLGETHTRRNRHEILGWQSYLCFTILGADIVCSCTRSPFICTHITATIPTVFASRHTTRAEGENR